MCDLLRKGQRMGVRFDLRIKQDTLDASPSVGFSKRDGIILREELVIPIGNADHQRGFLVQSSSLHVQEGPEISLVVGDDGHVCENCGR